MDETNDLSRLLRDEHGSFEMGITDETVPHATAEVHGGTEHLGWEEFGIANSPGFSVRFANRSPVNRKGCTDQRHPWIVPRRSVPFAGMGCKPLHFEDSYVTCWVRVPVLGIRSAEAFGCLYSKGIAGHRRVAV